MMSQTKTITRALAAVKNVSCQTQTEQMEKRTFCNNNVKTDNLEWILTQM